MCDLAFKSKQWISDMEIVNCVVSYGNLSDDIHGAKGGMDCSLIGQVNLSL